MHPSSHHPPRAGARGGPAAVAVAIALAAALVVGAGARPSAAAAAPSASAALDWLAAELDANGGTLPSSFDATVTDYGLTIDAVLALAAGGRGGTPTATAATAEVAAAASSYVTGADFGSPDDRYAGALAKLLLLVTAQGGDPHSVGGLDLEAELRARMQASGPQAGRFSDASGFGDFSNGIGQALAVLALARTAGGVPTEAVTFLVAQACPAGAFRVAYDSGDTCTDDAEGTVDATGFAVMALRSAPASVAATAALARAGDWLAGAQGPDGSFAGDANANSTGLGGVALRALDRYPAANAAAAAVAGLQVSGGPESGAIAFDAATRDGIAAGTVGDRDQLRRATAQGVLALGLAPYGEIGATAPVDPFPTATPSSPRAAPGDPVTVAASGFHPGEQVTATLGPDAVAADAVALGSTAASADGTVSLALTLPEVAPGSRRLELTGGISGLVVATTLEVTGAPGAPTTTAPSTTSTTPSTATTAPGGASGAPGPSPTTTRPAGRALGLTGADSRGLAALAVAVAMAGGLAHAAGRRRLPGPGRPPG